MYEVERPKPVFFDNLEGWGGEGEGGVQEGGDTCISLFN